MSCRLDKEHLLRTDGERTLCGRIAAYVGATDDPRRVSCRACRRVMKAKELGKGGGK